MNALISVPNAYKEIHKGHAVISVHHSPDGKYILTSSCDCTVTVTEAGTMNKVWKMCEHGDFVMSAIWNRDGSKVASGGRDHYLVITDSKTGKVLQKMDCGSEIRCVVFHPNGNCVICALHDCTLQVWNVGGNMENVLKGHDKAVYCCTISPDGSFIVSADDMGVIKTWDFVTGECKHTWKGDDFYYPTFLYFSQSGTKLLGSSYNKNAMLWGVEKDGSLRMTQTFKGHTRSVWSCALSLDETVACTSSGDKTVKLWDTRTGALIQTIPVDSEACSISLSPDESEIAVGHWNGYLSTFVLSK